MTINKQQNLIKDCLDESSRQVAETGEIENRQETDNLQLGFQNRIKHMAVPGKVSNLTILPHSSSPNPITGLGQFTPARKRRLEWKQQQVTRREWKESKREKRRNSAQERVQNEKIQCLQSIDQNPEGITCLFLYYFCNLTDFLDLNLGNE